MTQKRIDNRDLAKMSYMISEGRTNEEIAKVLSVNKATVGRNLGRAIDLGFLSAFYSEVPDTPMSRDEIQAELYPRYGELREAATAQASKNEGFAPKAIHMVWSGSSGEEGDRIKAFGENCAHKLIPLLRSADSVACAWGRHINVAIAAVEKRCSLAREANKDPFDLPSGAEKPHFMPVAGELINYPDPGNLSPSHAAARLQEAINPSSNGDDEPRSLWLQGIPARLPKWATAPEDHSGLIRRFLEESDNYRRIFGREGDAGIIEDVSAILTGVGTTTAQSQDPWALDTIRSESGEPAATNGAPDWNWLRKSACGNIAGVWIPKADCSQDDKDQIEDLNERWLGISRKQLHRCARLGNNEGPEKGKPGVIVLARGADKAEVLRQTIGMCSQLFIDQELADAFLDWEG